MTCIVAIKQNKSIFMGADSCGSNGHNFAIYPRKKVFISGAFIYGCTSSYRMIDILEHIFSPPARKIGYDPAAYMRKDFIPALIECFKKSGFASISNSVESGGCFLVGFDGIIFEVQKDFSVLEIPKHGAAIGSGGEAAGAVLYHLKDKSAVGANSVLNSALSAAAGTIASVRKPFFIEKLDAK